MTDINLVPLMPEIFLSIAAMVLLVLGVVREGDSTRLLTAGAVVSLLLALAILLTSDWTEVLTLQGMFKLDGFAGFMKVLIIAGLIAALALSDGFLQQEEIARFEYPVLVMLAGIGMMLMVSANNLLSLYMSLELQSLSLYVLAAFARNSARASEASVKYFTLGALSSGMLLFGISLIYGFSGSIDFGVIMASLGGGGPMPLGMLFGLVFILAGMAFKISAVPFHMWTPDVYEGAPTSVTALFAIVPKVAAMGLLMRLLLEPFAFASQEWMQIVYALSLASMVVGAFAALTQENIKRLLAYSSIGNMGYALIGLAAGGAAGASAVVLYLLIYMVMTAGVFAVVLSLRRKGVAVETIADFAGLSQQQPFLAYAMALLMFSMSGIPPLAGFFGKFMIFKAAVDAHLYVLAVLGVLTSVVAAYYYLRVIKVMFFDPAQAPFDRDVPLARLAVLGLSVLFILGFILAPSPLMDQMTAIVKVSLF